jgi:multidrug efflux system membrane fusion protein
VLFRIDPRALEATVDQARSSLVRDAALADAAERDDVRYATLSKEDYVSKEQADQMHAAALGTQAVVQADSAVLRSATVSLGFATLRSPIAGRVGKLIVHLGNVVSPTSGPLVVINQLHPIMVQFPILGQDLPLLRRAVAAHPLPVTAIASDTTNSAETGQLSLLDNAIDSLTGTVTGQAVLPNAHALFWPGQLVALTINAGVQKNAVAVRTEAVMTSQKGNYVFVVDPAGKTAQMRNIVSGRTLGSLTTVMSGLAAGEQVVVDGQSRLAPGSHVTIVPAPAVGDTASSTTLPTTPGAGSGTPAPTISPASATPPAAPAKAQPPPHP